MAEPDALAEQPGASLNLDDMISKASQQHAQSSKISQNGSTTESSTAGVALPPGLEAARSTKVDDLIAMMNKTPLFMTSLDETGEDGGENMALEALKALAYEGTRAEIAENFRQQGNDHAKTKNWKDAKEFYDKAIVALKSPPPNPPAETEVIEVDEVEEERKERAIAEACHANRALCHLELKNYRSCTLDCAAALRLNERNVKAWFRCASACLALDRIAEAEDACARGLVVDAENAPLQTLAQKIAKRKTYVEKVVAERREREQRAAAEKWTLAKALQQRKLSTRKSPRPPDLEDAAMALSDPLDPSSALSVPTMILYPAHQQSDFIKALSETDTMMDHLNYLFPLPWDSAGEYSPGSVECYMETKVGGLIKIGKKVKFAEALNSGKIEIMDGLTKVFVLPKSKAKGWIEEVKAAKEKEAK